MALYEVLYGRPCRSPICWGEVRERTIMGPELVRETTEKAHIIMGPELVQDRQKSYVDRRRRLLEFCRGVKVFFQISPKKGIFRFEKKEKLAPRFIGPFKILERIESLAYILALPPYLSFVHPVFYVSILRKYDPYLSYVLNWKDLNLTPEVYYEAEPVSILVFEERKLRNRKIAMVKVLWQHHREDEATWELEEDIKKSYPYLFEPEA